MEASKPSVIEFKTMVLKMLKELTDNYKELSENYISMKKEIEIINENQEEMNNKISEIKNTLEWITNRRDKAEDGISELEDKVENITQIQQERKRLRKNKEVMRELQDNKKHNNIHIIGLPQGEREEQGTENMSEKVMMENFPNLMREKSHTNPGNTESPNQEEPKEAHCKSHHN